MPWKSLFASPFAGSSSRTCFRVRTSKTATPGVSPTARCGIVTGLGPRSVMKAKRLSGDIATMSGVFPTNGISAITARVRGSITCALLVTRFTTQYWLPSGVKREPCASCPPDSLRWVDACARIHRVPHADAPIAAYEIHVLSIG